MLKKILLFSILLFIISCNEEKNVINKIETKNTEIQNNQIVKNEPKIDSVENKQSAELINKNSIEDKSGFQTKILKVENEPKQSSNKNDIAELVFSSKPIVDIAKIESPVVNTKTGERISKKALPKFLPEINNFEKFVASVGQSVDITDFTTVSTTYKNKNVSYQVMIYDYGYNNDFLGKQYFTKLPTDDAYEIKEVKVKDGKAYSMMNKLKKSGTLYALVYDRFYVTLEGLNINEINPLIDVLKKIDFVSMKKLTNKK